MRGRRRMLLVKSRRDEEERGRKERGRKEGKRLWNKCTGRD